MPRREEPLLTGSIYHIFTKTIDGRRLLTDRPYNDKFLNIIGYYRSTHTPVSFSTLTRIDKQLLPDLMQKNRAINHFLVEILAYCLMPTHFHLLVRQQKDQGVSRFVSNSLNSLTRYFNTVNTRKGPLFLPKFKAAAVRTDEQLIHVSRYIHLNPYSGGLIDTFADLASYPWSSLPVYINDKKDKYDLVNVRPVLELFRDHHVYRDFVFNHADYQRTLEYAKHTENW